MGELRSWRVCSTGTAFFQKSILSSEAQGAKQKLVQRSCGARAFKSASLDSRVGLNYTIIRNQTMNVRLLLGLLTSGLLCGCAANTPYSETVVDTEKHTQQRGLPETPVYNRPVYAPGQSDQISLGSH
jgi:hypothetical protein